MNNRVTSLSNLSANMEDQRNTLAFVFVINQLKDFFEETL